MASARTRIVVFVVAVVWACLIGGLMAVAASFLGADGQDVILIGILGGIGAAASVLVIAGKEGGG